MSSSEAILPGLIEEACRNAASNRNKGCQEERLSQMIVKNRSRVKEQVPNQIVDAGFFGANVLLIAHDMANEVVASKRFRIEQKDRAGQKSQSGKGKA